MTLIIMASDGKAYYSGTTTLRRGLYPDLFGEIGRGVPNVQAKKKLPEQQHRSNMQFI